MAIDLAISVVIVISISLAMKVLHPPNAFIKQTFVLSRPLANICDKMLTKCSHSSKTPCSLSLMSQLYFHFQLFLTESEID